jgi:hypothetical protein
VNLPRPASFKRLYRKRPGADIFPSTSDSGRRVTSGTALVAFHRRNPACPRKRRALSAEPVYEWRVTRRDCREVAD